MCFHLYLQKYLIIPVGFFPNLPTSCYIQIDITDLQLRVWWVFFLLKGVGVDLCRAFVYFQMIDFGIGATPPAA